MFWKAADERITELQGLISSIKASRSFWNESDPLYSSLHFEHSLYRREKEKLRNDRRDSITWCSVCYSFERDMVYRPVHSMWLCTECSAKIPDVIPD
ncbi:MAG: hypothetical protein ACTSUC_14555 [Promethearchaeota archaeon]